MSSIRSVGRLCSMPQGTGYWTSLRNSSGLGPMSMPEIKRLKLRYILLPRSISLKWCTSWQKKVHLLMRRIVLETLLYPQQYSDQEGEVR